MKSHSALPYGLLLLIPATILLVLLFAGISAKSGISLTPVGSQTDLATEVIWNLYPSPDPFSHSFRIDWPHNQTEISVYNKDGILVPASVSIYRSTDNWQYDIGSNLSPGLYILQMRTGNEIGFAKLAKTI